MSPDQIRLYALIELCTEQAETGKAMLKAAQSWSAVGPGLLHWKAICDIAEVHINRAQELKEQIETLRAKIDGGI